MALHHNPRIVTDGLIFAVDTADANSYSGTGTTVHDLAGSHSGGLLSGGTVFTNNRYFHFDGDNDSLQFATDDVFERGTSPFTMEAWVRLNTTGSNNLAMVMGGGNPLCDGCVGGFMILFTNTTNINVRFDDEGLGNLDSITYSRPTSFIDGDFHHIVGMRNGSNLLIYLDGEEVKSGTDRQVDVNDIGTFYISGWSNYRGDMDVAVAKIYNRALTASEVLQNYNATKSRFKNIPLNPITEVSGYAFKIDAANPSSYPGSGTTVTSVGSETFTSTLYGATYSSEGGGSFLFDGTDDIAISDISNFNVASMSFSVDSWFKFASPADTGSTDTHAFIGGGGWGGLGDAWHLGGRTYTNGYEEADFTFFGQGATGQVTTGYDEQEWNHYCGTYNINTGKAAVYLNGVQISIEDSTYISRTAMPLEWGAVIYSANTSNGIREYYQHGYIGPTRIWKDKELSEEEVLQNYNAAKTRFGL